MWKKHIGLYVMACVMALAVPAANAASLCRCDGAGTATVTQEMPCHDAANAAEKAPHNKAECDGCGCAHALPMASAAPIVFVSHPPAYFLVMPVRQSFRFSAQDVHSPPPKRSV